MTTTQEHFRLADFEAAETTLHMQEKESGKGADEAALKLAEIALLRNDHETVERWLREPIEGEDNARTRNRLLAESCTRRDLFEKVAPLERASGQQARADRAEALADRAANDIQGASTVRIPFAQIDPLPVVDAIVNGEKASFFLDTGGWEIMLDSAFAERAGIQSFGTVQGRFAGGQTADVQVGTADAVAFGDMRVENVPVHIKPMTTMTEHVFGRGLDGVLGTVFLYHFLSTIDYVGHELVLEPLGTTRPSDRTIVPFWLAGRHLILAKGSVNGIGPMLFHVDTGLGGGGFMCGASTVARARIDLDKGQAFEGMGGGGAVQAVAFDLAKLALGAVERGPIPSVYTETYPKEMQGIGLDGTISHQFFQPGSLTLDFDHMTLSIG